MNHPMFILSYQVEEPIRIQKVKSIVGLKSQMDCSIGAIEDEQYFLIDCLKFNIIKIFKAGL